MFKLAKNIVNKNLIIAKVFLKKVLKLFLCHQILSFKVTFIPIVLLNHYFAKKQDGKND